MRKIAADSYPIFFGNDSFEELNKYVKINNPSKVVVILDTNTSANCLDYFLAKMENSSHFITTVILEGEEHKNIATCIKLWQFLSDNHIDRHALVINLGGGTTTDIGGFVASTYLRGIGYINIPTSLLAMVDASVGGKTGVDFNGLKNQIGVIKSPEMVLIDVHFLKTLPQNEFNSGVAEILKHGLIASKSYWEVITGKTLTINNNIENIIYESVVLKNEIVQQDQHENGVRKLLNFGHTLGHAIESHFLSSKNKILHGEAIAIGMCLAGYISHKMLNFSKEELEQINSSYQQYFFKKAFKNEAIENIIALMKYDKKNSGGKSQFVLLKKIGEPKIDCVVSEELLFEAFEYYQTAF